MKLKQPFDALTSVAALAILLSCLNGPMPAQAQAAVDLPSQPQQLPVITLRAGMHLIKAEVAQRPREHAIGLMWRRAMGTNEGMLFIFPQKTVQCFWMKNTLIPLSAAFIADDGSVVNVVDMQPQTLKSHCSTEPVRYVLEMNQHWFSKRGIQQGFKLAGEVFTNR